MNYDIINDAIKEELFPGCAFAFWSGNQQWLYPFGRTHPVACGQEVSTSTLYDIASLTKILVFAGILQLVNRGKLSLEDRVAEILPFEKKGDIQKMDFRQLLSCGLDFDLPERIMREGLHVRHSDGTLLFYKEAFLRGPLGKMFRYGNPSAFIAGEVLQQVMKTDLESALRELVFDELGMNDTSFNITPARLGRIAPTQVVATNRWQFEGNVQDPMSLAFKRPVGIAGLFSNIYDMVNVSEMLADNMTLCGQPFISESLWADMVSNQHAGKEYPDGPHRYGLGIDMPFPGYVDDEVFCQKGLIMAGWSGPFVFACPSWSKGNLRPRPIGGVILSNARRDVPDAKAKLRAFRRKLVQTCLDSVTE